MKKEYIKPEMQMHEIKAQQLLAGSETPGFNPGQKPDDNSKRLRIYTLPFIVKVLTFAP